MALLDRIQEDLKDAMRAGEVDTRDALRMVLAALKNRRIEVGRDLDEGDEVAVLTKQVKSRQESAEQYDAAGRAELAAKERSEILVIRRYLPKPLTDDETRTLVAAKVAELGISKKSDLGQLMKALMAEHKGRIDGKTVQRLAGELLS